LPDSEPDGVPALQRVHAEENVDAKKARFIGPFSIFHCRGSAEIFPPLTLRMVRRHVHRRGKELQTI
jgi:hypothetical protein